jgi:hypothetical protein
MWEITLTVVGLLIVIGIVLKINSNRKSGSGICVIRNRPSDAYGSFNVTMFGVKWNVLYGRSFGYEYAFSEEPFCPKCMFQMDSVRKGSIIQRSYWHCIPCNMYYRIPIQSSYDAGRAVERYIESEIRSGRTSLRNR